MARIARPLICVSARAVLAWGLLSFAAAQVALAVAVDRWWPTLRYPEYGRKLALLETRTTAHRDEPLLLAIGTSRTAFGFCAAAASDERSWHFNFALTGIGPVQELACLHRLLRSGVRPAKLLIELHPPFLHQTPDWCETRAVDVRSLDQHDLAVLCRYAYQPRELVGRWLLSRLSPWYSFRVELMRRVAPTWLEADLHRDESMLADTDLCGWSRFPVRPADDAERRSFANRCADLYTVPLTRFEVTDVPRRAIGEMLALCRRQQIDAALVVMPEGDTFRRRYTAEALRRIDRYLNEVRRELSTPVFDCRAWCDDSQFCDGQHLLPEGAQAFTEQLLGERLLPWFAESKRAALELAQRERDRER
jgi:hypothetical protein